MKSATVAAAPPPAPRVIGRFRLTHEEVIDYQVDLPAIRATLQPAEVLDRSVAFQGIAERERLQELVRRLGARGMRGRF